MRPAWTTEQDPVSKQKQNNHKREDFSPNKLKTHMYMQICTQMFTNALFIIAKIWEQPRRPSRAEG
jgi:hypothetical protein